MLSTVVEVAAADSGETSANTPQEPGPPRHLHSSGPEAIGAGGKAQQAHPRRTPATRSSTLSSKELSDDHHHAPTR